MGGYSPAGLDTVMGRVKLEHWSAGATIVMGGKVTAPAATVTWSKPAMRGSDWMVTSEVKSLTAMFPKESSRRTERPAIGT